MIVSPWIVQLIVVVFVGAIVELIYLKAGGPRDVISMLQVGLFALVGYVIVRRQALGFRSAKTLDDLWFRFKLPWIPWDEWPEDERRFAKVGWSLMFAFVLLSLVRMFRKH